MKFPLGEAARRSWLLAILLPAALATGPALAIDRDEVPSLPDVELVAIDAALESAVLLWQGELHLVHAGEDLSGDAGANGFEVVDVLGDRVVLEQVVDEPRPHRRRLWLRYGEDGASAVELFDPAAYAPEPLREPLIVRVPPTEAEAEREEDEP